MVEKILEEDHLPAIYKQVKWGDVGPSLLIYFELIKYGFQAIQGGKVTRGSFMSVLTNDDFPHGYELDIFPELNNIDPVLYYPKVLSEGIDVGVSVKVWPFHLHSWVGFFERGPASRDAKNAVYTCPHDEYVCIVSRGKGYLVNTINPDDYSLLEANPVIYINSLVDRGLLIVADPWGVFAYDRQGLKWSTGRISIENIKIIGFDECGIQGVSDPGDEEESEFSIDLVTGHVTGGNTIWGNL